MPEVAYQPTGITLGNGRLPYLRVRLFGPKTSLEVLALVDSGASISVLPFSVGEKLGYNWEESLSIQITGNLSAAQSKLIAARVRVPEVGSTSVAFAWTQSPLGKVILGQEDFFDTFDIHFRGSRKTFEIQHAS